MKKNKAPLLSVLKDYAEKNPVRLHMPGHKGKMFFPLQKLLSKNIFKFDVTELPGFDNLHDPKGVIKRSQENLSLLYGAKKSFYLVNGATSGIIAALATFLNEGEKVLIPRNSHRSVLNGIILTRSMPLYLTPEIDEDLGICLDVSCDKWEKVIKSEKNIKAVVITNPNYNGICPDIKNIIKIAQKNKIKTIVDEAHGPHFIFSKKLPLSAGECGADIWVQSPHKMLISFTQSAWLHFNGQKKEEERLKRYLSLITSTSPSYLMLASLDITVEFLRNFGKSFVEKGVELAEFARSKINKFTPFFCPGSEYAKNKGFFFDLSRLIVNTSSAGYSGINVEKILRKQYNIFAEYADLNNVYFLITGANSKREILKLIKALSSFKSKERIKFPIAGFKIPPKIILTPYEAFIKRYEYIPYSHAAGRICKDPIIPYPPGIPLLNPGELIQKEHIDVINQLVSNDYYCYGLKNNCIAVVKDG